MKDDGRLLSTVRLYYNSGTGYNCAVNVWAGGVRQKKKIGIALRSKQSRWVRDVGSFKVYAGPVKVYGKNRCGQVMSASVTKSYGGGYASGWTACR